MRVKSFRGAFTVIGAVIQALRYTIIDNNQKDGNITNATFFYSSLLELGTKEPHFDRVDNFCHPSCTMHSSRHSKTEFKEQEHLQERQLRAREILCNRLVAVQLPDAMSKFQDVITLWGHLPKGLMRLSEICHFQ